MKRAWIRTDAFGVIWADPQTLQTMISEQTRRWQQTPHAPPVDQVQTLIQDVLPQGLHVTRARRLGGGSVHQVWQIECESNTSIASDAMDCGGQVAHQPGDLLTHSFVAKINQKAYRTFVRQEFDALNWLNEQTQLRVPKVYGWFEGSCESNQFAGFLMQRVKGKVLSDARLSVRGQQVIQDQLAQQVSMMHRHCGPGFGDACLAAKTTQSTASSLHQSWSSVFGQMLGFEIKTSADLLSSKARWIATEIVDQIDRLLPDGCVPRLVHGDLWANNIIVDDAHPDRPRLMAMIDCGAMYADREYELAYLELFETITPQFWQTYTLPLRPGYEYRRQIYWLHAMMMHLRLFGNRFMADIERTTQFIREHMLR